MTKREIAVLACRIVALVALINVIQASAFLLPLLYEAFNPEKFAAGMGSPIGYFPLPTLLALVYLSPVVLLLLLAGFLWMQADYVAAKLVGDSDENVVTTGVNESAQALAFSILGAYVLTLALPRLSQLLVNAWNVGSQNATLHRDWTGFAPNLVFAATEIVLGLYLLLGARGLVTLLSDIRNVGRDRRSQSEENPSDDVSIWPEN